MNVPSLVERVSLPGGLVLPPPPLPPPQRRLLEHHPPVLVRQTQNLSIVKKYGYCDSLAFLIDIRESVQVELIFQSHLLVPLDRAEPHGVGRRHRVGRAGNVV